MYIQLILSVKTCEDFKQNLLRHGTNDNLLFDLAKINDILGVIKRNPLFFHSISNKNNGFLFTTPNIT